MKRVRLVVVVTMTMTIVASWVHAIEEVREPERIFTTRTIVVQGQGAAPVDRPLSPGQKQLMAKRAAKIVALRELAEALAGVRIVSSTLVRDAATASDEAHAEMNAIVQGAHVIEESYDAGAEVATVWLQVELDGPNGVLGRLLTLAPRPKRIAAPAPRTSAPSRPLMVDLAPVDSLIIDASGTRFSPAVVNTITSDSGVLFDVRTQRPDVTASAPGEYARSVDHARALLAKRQCTRPMVVVPDSIVANTAVRLTAPDADAIRAADAARKFLDAGDVVFVF
jgi:hypothetical protein